MVAREAGMMWIRRILVVAIVTTVIGGVSLPQIYADTSMSTTMPSHFTVIEWSQWPLLLQKYANSECIYGDRKIDPEEADYVVRLLFSRGVRYSRDGNDELRALGSMFKLFGVDVAIRNDSARKISQYTKRELEEIQKIIEESTAIRPLDEISETCKNIVSKKGDVLITDGSMLVDIPYHLLHTEGITPAIYAKYAMTNVAGFGYAIDWIRVHVSPDDYISALLEAASATGSATTFFVQAMDLCQYASPTTSAIWIAKARDAVPHSITADGKRVYETRTGMDMPTMLLRAADRADQASKVYLQYEKAKTRSESLIEFFSTDSSGRGIEDKAWLLYRHHSNLVLQMLDRYGMRTDVAIDTQERWVWMMFLQHATTLDSYVVDWEKIKTIIRKIAFDGNSPVQKINGLLLLEKISSEEDIERLVKLAADETKITWESGEKTYAEPLVAYRAVGCIYTVGTAKSRQALEKIAHNSKIDPRVRASAEDLAKQSQLKR